MVSIERRLKRRLLLGVLLVSLVLGVAVQIQMHSQQSDLLNYQLEQVARALILSDLQGTDQTWDDDPALHLDVQIWDAEGNRLYRSSEQIDVAINTPPGLSNVRSGPQRDAVLLKIFTLSNRQRTVQVMHSKALRNALYWDAGLEVLVPALLVMLVGALLVAMTIRHELAPIRALDAELRRRDARSLQPVVLPDAPAELSRVIDTLNHLLQQLNASLQAHKRFIADAAHELRTPITALGLEVNNLARGQDLAQMHHSTERIKRSVQRAQHVLQQMLTLARLEARLQPRPRQPVDLQSLAQTAMVGLSTLASHRGIEFALSCADSVMIPGDPDDLRLLLDNLLGNALKFSPENSVIDMCLRRDEQHVTLLLRDHGPGIAPAIRERIVLPFVRADSVTEGSGLGLAIATDVVHSHGGQMTLEDPSGGLGLLVRVRFPAWQDQAAQRLPSVG